MQCLLVSNYDFYNLVIIMFEHHVVYVNKMRRFPCKLCSKLFSQTSDIKKHIKHDQVHKRLFERLEMFIWKNSSLPSVLKKPHLPALPLLNVLTHRKMCTNNDLLYKMLKDYSFNDWKLQDYLQVHHVYGHYMWTSLSVP